MTLQMDKKGFLFLTVRISVIEVGADADMLQLAIRALEKRPVGVLGEGANQQVLWDSESSEEDERGGLELIEAFKHLQKAVGPSSPQKINYHISKNLEDEEADADFSDEEEKRENSNQPNFQKDNGGKTRNVINKVGSGAMGILGGALGIGSGITKDSYQE